MSYPQTVEDFNVQVGEFQASIAYREPLLFAVGQRVETRDGTIASVRYPVVNGPGENTGTAAILMKVFGVEPEGVKSVVLTRRMLQDALSHFSAFEDDGKVHKNIEVLRRAYDCSTRGTIVATFIFDDVPPESVDDATLKLYGLSCRHFKPNDLNLDKIFKVLPNVTWVGDIPMDVEEVGGSLMAAAFEGKEFAPHAADKFPLYLHRINALKMGVRICDQHAARLGAYLGEGTVIMYGGYANFNAGTEGPSMLEGLAASSAIVGAGSDIGNGARMIGVLSGGNDVPISIGRNCLLELNSVLGIPIADAVIITAGTSVMAGSLVNVKVKGHPHFGGTVKASTLSDLNAVTFRRNDRDGILEVVRTARNEEFARKLADGETILNKDLHQNT